MIIEIPVITIMRIIGRVMIVKATMMTIISKNEKNIEKQSHISELLLTKLMIQIGLHKEIREYSTGYTYDSTYRSWQTLNNSACKEKYFGNYHLLS